MRMHAPKAGKERIDLMWRSVWLLQGAAGGQCAGIS
jgi:hypothetical protein